jgi:hypothetical protein
MALLYADENFDFPVVVTLRRLGHDVLTVQEARRAGAQDPEVLADATASKPNGPHLQPTAFLAAPSPGCSARRNHQLHK